MTARSIVFTDIFVIINLKCIVELIFFIHKKFVLKKVNIEIAVIVNINNTVLL